MCDSGEKKASENLAEAQGNAGKQAQSQFNAAGYNAQQQMLKASQPTAEESSRLQRYTTSAKTPGESLMQQQGPIAQAVARQIQERASNPGLDYQTNLPAFAQGVTTPLVQQLKARGIMTQPGQEGGLGMEQYFKDALPQMAQLRTNQINTDINNATNYGQLAQALQQYFLGQEANLGNALGNRAYQGGVLGAQANLGAVEQGIPYGYGAMVNPAQTNLNYANQQAQNMAGIGSLAGQAGLMALGSALAPVTGGGSTILSTALGKLLNPQTATTAGNVVAAEPSPYERAIQGRMSLNKDYYPY